MLDHRFAVSVKNLCVKTLILTDGRFEVAQTMAELWHMIMDHPT